MPKRKHAPDIHPLDASGVLQAAKTGEWGVFRDCLQNYPHLTFDDFNTLPPGRSFGVVHQIAYHGDDDARAALQVLLERHPRVDLTLRTKNGLTPQQVAIEEQASTAFVNYLDERLQIQTHHELINKVRRMLVDLVRGEMTDLRLYSNLSRPEKEIGLPFGLSWALAVETRPSILILSTVCRRDAYGEFFIKCAIGAMRLCWSSCWPLFPISI